MRAREFTINVPIKINIDGDNDPDISTTDDYQEPVRPAPKIKKIKNTNTDNVGNVFVPPLQQQIELQKSAQGKSSPYIDELLDDDPEIGEEEDSTEIGAPKKKLKRR